MSKYLTLVPQEKIDLINSLLNDPVVGPLYEAYLSHPQYEVGANIKLIEAKNAAFKEYAYARDKFLGLPHLDQLPNVVTEMRKRFLA